MAEPKVNPEQGAIARELRRIADALELRLIALYGSEEDHREILHPAIRVYSDQWRPKKEK